MTMVHSIGKYSMIPLYVLCIALCYPVSGQSVIKDVTAAGELGKEAVLTCILSQNVSIDWLYQGKKLKMDKRFIQRRQLTEPSEGENRDIEVILKIDKTVDKDSGNYTCKTDSESKSKMLDLPFPGKLVRASENVNITDMSTKPIVNLTCVFEVYNQTKVEWILKRDGFNDTELEENIQTNRNATNKKLLTSSYSTTISSFDEQNGKYVCQVWDPVLLKYHSGETEVLIYLKPTLSIDQAIPISSSQIFFNWTVKTFNSKIIGYHLFIKVNGSLIQNKKRVDANETYFLIEDLNANSTYNINLTVVTEFDMSHPATFHHDVRTLSYDPVFVPTISINGFSAKSMTIGLLAPPPDIAQYIHGYELERWDDENPKRVAYHPRDDNNLPYMFNNLTPHTTYKFRARACSQYTMHERTRTCGNFSEIMEAVTLDGTPDKPTDVNILCQKEDDRVSLKLTWGPPAKPNAEIKGYMMEVTGNATYIDRFGIEHVDTWGPLSKFMTNISRSGRVDDLKPNTNYTVRLSAMTRTRRRGVEEVARCASPRAPPDHPPRPRWRKHAEKINDNIKYTLRVLVPRSSERNGPICCYRVYVVRLAGVGWSKLPAPQGLPLLAPGAAHQLGAYVTDVFSNANFPKEELIIGDQKSITLPRIEGNRTCARCFEKPRTEPPPTRPPPTTTTELDDTTDDILEDKRERRSADLYINDEIMRDTKPAEPAELELSDEELDPLVNYTLFVELIPGVEDAEPLYSAYTVALNTAIPPAALAANTMELALQICCAVAALILLGTIVYCVVHTRRSRKLPPRHAQVELGPLQALRSMFGGLGGRQQLAAAPPEMPPLPLEQLAAAYAERAADSDYGFQKEFELLQMLPECYPDRTSHASEARENQPKNRYPDIKAYDQTRVKLTQIDGVAGSDYINANYVMGYQEHKQFICAQGPTEATVNDFWRMIWEHGLELIVMLTNLEEYSKVKCSKYWPDEVRGSRAFGAITVHHVGEKRYSDYIVRELKITKQPVNSEGQPIVENNGVAKRNGDCKDAESGSAPTSPREAKDTSRIVRQYHFLMWKDFAAPEHPQSILKFIKRVNEAWSSMMGRPVVVHCSAGVGRTGTLVALDCLLEQLRCTRRAAVFTTIAELRRQRNFLVQSLKQYVFVYRALVEYAHYGDTEIPASRLKASIDRLRNTPEGGDKCLMEHEFEKMMNPPVSSPVKSCAAALAEEARARNRSADHLPYDRNRVILAPAPPAVYCTYINASFVEAYDNSEGYIITQDPLPNYIMDFWRMVSEHNVSTIVMLSELGEGKCPRYWDDGSAQYEHISVQYEESESCPYYTRRQFRVTNNKSGDVSMVRQLQYHGWPTAPGHVPEVTRGLAELAAGARAAQPPAPSAAVVHCQYGTERSALFAALCILIAQLRTERRVDVAAAARKLRDQRAHTIDTFLQYEFLHRAILNYAELHNLLEDS